MAQGFQRLERIFSITKKDPSAKKLTKSTDVKDDAASPAATTADVQEQFPPPAFMKPTASGMTPRMEYDSWTDGSSDKASRPSTRGGSIRRSLSARKAAASSDSIHRPTTPKYLPSKLHKRKDSAVVTDLSNSALSSKTALGRETSASSSAASTSPTKRALDRSDSKGKGSQKAQSKIPRKDVAKPSDTPGRRPAMSESSVTSEWRSAALALATSHDSTVPGCVLIDHSKDGEEAAIPISSRPGPQGLPADLKAKLKGSSNRDSYDFIFSSAIVTPLQRARSPTWNGGLSQPKQVDSLQSRLPVPAFKSHRRYGSSPNARTMIPSCPNPPVDSPPQSDAGTSEPKTPRRRCPPSFTGLPSTNPQLTPSPSPDKNSMRRMRSDSSMMEHFCLQDPPVNHKLRPARSSPALKKGQDSKLPRRASSTAGQQAGQKTGQHVRSAQSLSVFPNDPPPPPPLSRAASTASYHLRAARSAPVLEKAQNPQPIKKAVSATALTSRASTTATRKILREPTYSDFWELDDEDIAESRPGTPPLIVEDIPPTSDQDGPQVLNPKAAEESITPSAPANIRPIGVTLPTRGALETARIAKAYNFDLVYIVKLSPTTTEASPVPAKSQDSVIEDPNSGTTGQLLAAYGLHEIAPPFRISAPVHMKMLQSKTWIEYRNPQAQSEEFSRGFACSFHTDYVESAGRASQESNGSGKSTVPNSGIVFAGYTKRKNETLSGLEMYADKMETLWKLYRDAERLADAVISGDTDSPPPSRPVTQGTTEVVASKEANSPTLGAAAPVEPPKSTPKRVRKKSLSSRMFYLIGANRG